MSIMLAVVLTSISMMIAVVLTMVFIAVSLTRGSQLLAARMGLARMEMILVHPRTRYREARVVAARH